MSQYLALDGTDTDFYPEGITPTVAQVIRASGIIDTYCKREIKTKPYTERIPLTSAQRGHLTFYPVIEVTAASGRAAQGIIGGFFGPPEFESISDLSLLDIDRSIGSLWCGGSPFGMPYSELEITYTSGWDIIPDKVKVACGLLIGKLATNYDSNVKSKKDFDFSIEYFGSGMVTPEIADLLAEYQLMTFR
ncbi:hypothetical protein OB236_38345 [Paenibacillus sp. WQ 127069]|uniref:Uncharacterized protein n=1 Tax=Paenibacillus baimaensis TaxID=2982185 RepID=A0ABT2UTN5_9BACL|nr:hypothetical protein [Paenibacillus sp. WQ 127069]MCU6798002.1 hypothetical protein [Paenibacillus sp. WQ 127069]